MSRPRPCLFALRTSAALLLALSAVTVGCGSSKDERAEGPSKLDVVKVEFPREQTLAERSTLKIVVRNMSKASLPSVLATVETASPAGQATTAFGRRDAREGLADRMRPIWILDRGPEGGDTVYNNTWKIGPLPAGGKKSFSWDVTAVRPGKYKLRYTLQDRVSSARTGSLSIHVKSSPPAARVTDDGAVARD